MTAPLTPIDWSRRELRELMEANARRGAEISALRSALQEIATQDPVEMALDPQWAKRVAAAALLAKESGDHVSANAQAAASIYQTGWPRPETVWGDVPKEVYDTYTEFGYTRRRIVYEAPTLPAAQEKEA